MLESSTLQSSTPLSPTPLSQTPLLQTLQSQTLESQTVESQALQSQTSQPKHKFDHDSDICLSMLAGSLDRIERQIKYADTKGGIIASSSAVLASFVITSVRQLNSGASSVHTVSHAAVFWFAACTAAVYIVCAVLSVACAVMAIMPRLATGGWTTMTFFSHVASKYGWDHSRYCQDATRMTSQQWAEELSAQIVAVSNIVDRKQRLIHRSAQWMIGSLSLWLCCMVAMQFIH